MEHFTLIMIIERLHFLFLLLFTYIFFFSHFKLFQTYFSHFNLFYLILNKNWSTLRDIAVGKILAEWKKFGGGRKKYLLCFAFSRKNQLSSDKLFPFTLQLVCRALHRVMFSTWTQQSNNTVSASFKARFWDNLKHLICGLTYANSDIRGLNSVIIKTDTIIRLISITLLRILMHLADIFPCFKEKLTKFW